MSYLPEAQALFARMTTEPDATRKGLINTLIGSLITAGVWSKLDALYVMAAHDAQAARQNWIADAFNLTAVSSPAFTLDRGYQGDGSSSYLETGFNPTTATTPKFAQNSAHLSFWSRSSGQGNSVDIGNNNSVIACRLANDTFARRCNGVNSATGAELNGSGLFLHTRTGPAVGRAFVRGGSVLPDAISSTTPDNNSIRVLGRSGAVSFSARQAAAASIGGALTDAEALAYFNALNAYLTATGAA